MRRTGLFPAKIHGREKANTGGVHAAGVRFFTIAFRVS